MTPKEKIMREALETIQALGDALSAREAKAAFIEARLLPDQVCGNCRFDDSCYICSVVDELNDHESFGCNEWEAKDGSKS